MLAVIDHRLPKACQESLERLSFTLLPLPPFPRLSAPVASHPDMLLLRVKDKLFCHREYYSIAKSEIEHIRSASGLSLCLTEDDISETYPFDVALNLVFTGNILIGKTEKMAKKVKEYADARHIPTLSVKQGYAKCSSVVLDSAIITADVGIDMAARAAGLDCLLVSSGGVSLPPYAHGFLGGASGVCGKTVFFGGDIQRHKDARQIESFCHERSYDVISLSREPLFDAGTMLFF